MSSRVNQDDLWDGLRTSWLRHLRARLLAPKTQKIYLQAAERFCSHLGAMPTAAVTNKHVEAFLVDYAATRAPATVSQTYRALQQFFNWLVSEDEIAINPTARMKAPTVPETPVVTRAASSWNFGRGTREAGHAVADVGFRYRCTTPTSSMSKLAPPAEPV